jgi:uncharacterized SAM-binding protein YcdF (DUF218 family)
MMDWIVLRKILAGFVLPPAGPIICVMLGLALMGRRQRLGKTLAWLGVSSLMALSLPAVSSWLVDVAGGAEPLDLTRPLTAQAIIITGGGVRVHAPEYGGSTMGQLTLDRARYGAYLARKTGLPVLVTGGKIPQGASEGELMRGALQQEFAVTVRWFEGESRNTSENARFSAAVLKPEGVSRILLVTHAFDVRRARMEFEAAGFQVTPAPTGVGANTPQPMAVLDFFPSARALQESYYACYELIALLMKQVITL